MLKAQSSPPPAIFVHPTKISLKPLTAASITVWIANETTVATFHMSRTRKSFQKHGYHIVKMSIVRLRSSINSKDKLVISDDLSAYLECPTHVRTRGSREDGDGEQLAFGGTDRQDPNSLQ